MAYVVIGKQKSKMNKETIPPALITAILDAEQMVALTGAGISAESGIPTFREAQTGLWAKYDPQELATPQAFAEHPRTVLLWYQWRKSLIAQSEPNPGHLALASLEKMALKRGQGFTLITQNVDHLHQQAGSQAIIELHGNIFRSKCAQCQQQPSSELPKVTTGSELPRCPSCGGLYRPDVVWFGENLPRDALQRAFEKSNNCDLFLSIGTSAKVQPAASLPIMAVQNGATLVEINPNPTPLTPTVNYAIQDNAGQILPLIEKEIRNHLK